MNFLVFLNFTLKGKIYEAYKVYEVLGFRRPGEL